MSEQTRIPRRSVALLFGPLLVLCIASSAQSGLGEEAQEKAVAAKVAEKVEEARVKPAETAADRAALRHFNQKLTEYARLHDSRMAKPGTPETPETQKALAAAIVARRPKARQGDIFLPEIQPLFRRLISEQLKGPDTQAARKAVAEGNPGHDEDSVPVTVAVNVVYPTGASRSTVPPSVLLTLPKLPESLHYRFVDRDLVLVDSVAQLIVDFLPATTPALPAK